MRSTAPHTHDRVSIQASKVVLTGGPVAAHLTRLAMGLLSGMVEDGRVYHAAARTGQNDRGCCPTQRSGPSKGGCASRPRRAVGSSAFALERKAFVKLSRQRRPKRRHERAFPERSGSPCSGDAEASGDPAAVCSSGRTLLEIQTEASAGHGAGLKRSHLVFWHVLTQSRWGTEEVTSMDQIPR